MNNTSVTYLFILMILISACSSVKLTNRNEKDIFLNSTNYKQLYGTYSNIPVDTAHFHRTLIGNFQFDTLFKQPKPSFVTIAPIDNKSISLKLFKADSIICTLKVKGELRKGYFKVGGKSKVSFKAGPLLWTLGQNLKYIGLTKENNLVMINSGSGGVLFFIILPIMAGGESQFENIYQRTK